MAKKYKSRHKGSEIDNAVDKVDNLATVATTGSYNDLTDKPDIPSGGADITVDESLSSTSTNPVQNKVIATELNKKGTYTKPNNGIPKSDLASDVQDSLNKAATALQSVPEGYVQTFSFTNLSAATWVEDATYADFGYRCDIACSGVTSDDYAEVVFDIAEATSGVYAPICETKTNAVSIWSSENTTITIPTIIITR